MFYYEHDLTYSVYISDQKFKNFIDLLPISNENNVYIKDFNRFTCNKIKNENKKTFANVVYNVLVVRRSDRTQETLLKNKW